MLDVFITMSSFQRQGGMDSVLPTVLSTMWAMTLPMQELQDLISLCGLTLEPSPAT